MIDGKEQMGDVDKTACLASLKTKGNYSTNIWVCIHLYTLGAPQPMGFAALLLVLAAFSGVSLFCTNSW